MHFQKERIINIYLTNLDSSGNSGSLGTISWYPKIPEMCSSFEICYPKCSLRVRFLRYSGSEFSWVRSSGSVFMPRASSMDLGVQLWERRALPGHMVGSTRVQRVHPPSTLSLSWTNSLGSSRWTSVDGSGTGLVTMLARATSRANSIPSSTSAACACSSLFFFFHSRA
jgi:hypothetical protein